MQLKRMEAWQTQGADQAIKGGTGNKEAQEGGRQANQTLGLNFRERPLSSKIEATLKKCAVTTLHARELLATDITAGGGTEKRNSEAGQGGVQYRRRGLVAGARATAGWDRCWRSKAPALAIQLQAALRPSRPARAHKIGYWCMFRMQGSCIAVCQVCGNSLRQRRKAGNHQGGDRGSAARPES